MFQLFEGRVLNENAGYVGLSCLILFDVGIKLVTAFGNLMPRFLPRWKCYAETELLLRDHEDHRRCNGEDQREELMTHWGSAWRIDDALEISVEDRWRAGHQHRGSMMRYTSAATRTKTFHLNAIEAERGGVRIGRFSALRVCVSSQI